MTKGKAADKTIAMFVLAGISFLMVLGNAILIPALPSMQPLMHVSAMQVSLLISLFSISAGCVIPVAGFLSDRMPRKMVMVPGLLLFGTGGIVAGCAAWWIEYPYPWVAVGRVVQGVGAAGTASIAMAAVGDLFTGEQRSRALGVNEAGNALGKVISPIVGAAVTLLAWFAVFFVFPILCLPLSVAVCKFIPEPSERAEATSLHEQCIAILDVVRTQGHWLASAYLCGSVALFTLFGLLFHLSEVLESHYGSGGMAKGLLLAVPLLWLCSLALLSGFLIKKRKSLMKWMIVCGFGCLAMVAGLGLMVPAGVGWLMGIVTLGSASIGAVLPSLNTLITSAVDAAKRGVVLSFYGSVRVFGVAAGPPVFTWLQGISRAAVFLTVLGLCAICAAAAWWFLRPPKYGPPGAHEVAHPPLHTRKNVRL